MLGGRNSSRTTERKPRSQKRGAVTKIARWNCGESSWLEQGDGRRTELRKAGFDPDQYLASRNVVYLRRRRRGRYRPLLIME